MLEFIKGIKCGIRMAGPHILESFIKIPLGIVIMLFPLYGIDKLIKLSPVAIPSSVICMLILFIGLLALEKVIGTKRVSTILSWINVPCAFTLRWMSIFFTPSFTLLPLATPVSVAEAFEIAAVFVVGYVILMTCVAFLVRGLQKFTNTKRRPFSSTSNDDTPGIEMTRSPSASSSAAGGASGTSRGNDPTPITSEPSRIASINRPHNPGVSLQKVESARNCVQRRPQQTKEELTDRSKTIGNFIAAQFDWFAYAAMVVAGIPIYLTTGYAMPLHLGTICLLYLGALKIPAKFKRVLHPIIVSGSSAILFVYIYSLMKGESLMQSMHDYKTGRNYLYLFDKSYSSKLPGAGDVLSTLLDVSIVALAIPMYNYRTDLKRHLFILIVPCTLSGIACFFIYPPLSYAVGVQSTRALAFMARSVTLALALPIVAAVQGSSQMISVIAILSGICGVLFGGLILGKRGLRIRQDDYVTRGITLGINSSAVASAHLLPTDPRAAALSSLSFFLYGIVMIVLSAIPPFANAVRSWVDLPPLQI